MSCDVLDYSQIHRFHSEYFRRNRPVILRGIDATKKYNVFNWSSSYFENVFGDQKVPVIETSTGYLSYERNVVEMPYREFVARSFGADASPSMSYYFKNSLKMVPAGHDDSEKIEALAPYIRQSMLRNLWISRGGLTVGLHFDHADNLNFQLRGEKIFMLYPPGILPYYPMPMFSETAHISRVFRDGPAPDLRKFPRFDASKAVPITLRAGDVLYLPAYWWHQVESLGDENVNVNFWWLPPALKQVVNWNQALRGWFQIWLRTMRHGSIEKAASKKGASERQ